MAGYFDKLDGRVYDGGHKAGEELANGVFASITANGVKKLTAAGDAKFRVEEKTSLWGLPAVRLVCTATGTAEIYFVENEWEIYGDKDYDESDYTIPAGHLVRMRRPVLNDEVIMSIDATLFASLNVGDEVKPAAGGTIVAA